MGQEATGRRDESGEMRKRRVMLADGRYLIFYSFGDEATGTHSAGEVVTARPEPDTDPVAEEGRGV